VTIDRERVRRVAHLARLSLSEAEEERLAAQLSQVLGYVESLSAVDVAGIEPLAFAGDADPAQAEALLREDRAEPGLEREAALQAAPSRDEQAFLVPRVIE
jgi:aspartyl-tRNA(Asn)/glutamyl-tRNA(Gln) amidotransferase subunit C